MVSEGGGHDGRQERWRSHNLERRRRILDAAIAEIERGHPGEEISVADVAARAGVGRTVLYRHFADRDALDRAVQRRVLDDLIQELAPAVRLEGTAPQIIDRIIRTYVTWAEHHPNLHRVADHDTAADGPLQQQMEELARLVSAVIGMALLALGAEPDEETHAELDSVVFGLVGFVFGSVRRWLSGGGPAIGAEALIRLTSDSVWYTIDGHARVKFGLEIDPGTELQQLFDPDLIVASAEV